MDRIGEMLNELKEIGSNPKKAVEEHRASTGKGAVGIVPYYAPEELVHAAGYLPVGIWGSQTAISKARAYLPPFACSLMQSVMELELSGTYDMLDAVIFTSVCDTLKCMGQKWKGKCPSIQLTHPQNRELEAANVYLMEEYGSVRERLEEILGEKITDEDISRSIEVYNENRAVMREFVKVAAEYPQVIDAKARHAVIRARLFMEKSAHTKKVRALIDEVKKQPVKKWEGKKVILTGILAEPDELLDILGQFGLAVAGDDLAQESRQFRTDVPGSGDEKPLYRLARQWQDIEGCSLAGDFKKVHGGKLMKLAEETGADAVIVCMMKFCDPEEYDFAVYNTQFDEAGVRYLYLEIDQEAVSFEQARTRVQSFAEML